MRQTSILCSVRISGNAPPGRPVIAHSKTARVMVEAENDGSQRLWGRLASVEGSPKVAANGGPQNLRMCVREKRDKKGGSTTRFCSSPRRPAVPPRFPSLPGTFFHFVAADCWPMTKRVGCKVQPVFVLGEVGSVYYLCASNIVGFLCFCAS